jgi:LacI family transcriptional regulator
VGFIRGLRDKGFDVPKDYSVVGIDGTDICEYMQPQLSSIAPDKEGMVRYAIESLIRMIEGEDVSIRSTTFSTKLIERNS